MKAKLLLIVIIIFIEAIFAGLNIKNASDINLGFTVLKEVPVFLSITISFVIGVLIAFPFAFFTAKKGKKNKKDTVKFEDESKSDKKQKKQKDGDFEV